jgi:transcriptional regulator with XRE-family HTH domain
MLRARGVSAAAIARETGVSSQLVWFQLTGRRRLTLDVAHAAARLSGIGLNVLFPGEVEFADRDLSRIARARARKP